MARRYHILPFLMLAAVVYSSQTLAENSLPSPSNQAAAAKLLTKQTATSEIPINAKALLGRTYEAKAREALERYLPAREFEIIVEVTPNNKVLPRAPYEPRALTPGSPLNMPLEELDTYIDKMQAQILLSSRLSSSQKRIEDIFSRAMSFNKQRGDTLVFAPLGIEIDDQPWSKERGDLKQEIAIMKSENERIARELADAKTTLLAEREKKPPDTQKIDVTSTLNTKNDFKSELKGGLGGENTKVEEVNPYLKKPWYLPSIVGGAFAILLLGLLALGIALNSAGRNMGGGLSGIADAMGSIGGALSSRMPAAAAGGGGIQSLEAKMSMEGGKSSGLASLPIDSIHAHLLKMRTEMLDTMSDQTESIILRYLTHLLSQPATVSRGVIVLELLGRDVATELFIRLGVKSQEAVMIFLRSGIYERSKIELMLEAAEELKTKLMMENFDRKSGGPSEKVAAKMLQISDEDLVRVAVQLDTQFLPRLFLYLEPRRIADLFKNLRRADTQKYEETVGTLARMPEASVADQHDDNIAVALDDIINEAKNDTQRPFLKIYQDIIEASEDEVGEQIVRELSSDPRVETFFRENVVGLHTLFSITPDQRAEIIETLSNKDVAALAIHVKDDERQILFDALTPRRRDMVTEEYESLSSRGGRQAGYAFKRVRESVVKRLRDLKAEGGLITTSHNPDTGATQEAA